MTTLKETKEKINADSENWKLYFYDFVDDFRYYKNVEMISESFSFNNEKFDALLASTAEKLCDEIGLEIPKWLNETPSCKTPFFVAGFENLKATAIVESPLRFRIRNVFVTESFLQRA
jgi:hypothetical protein